MRQYARCALSKIAVTFDAILKCTLVPVHLHTIKHRAQTRAVLLTITDSLSL